MARRYRLVGTLDLNQLWLIQRRYGVNESCCGRAEHHTACWSDGLHPLGHSDVFTDGCVTQSARTHFTGDYLAGVKADPNLKINGISPLHLLGNEFRLLLNAQCGEACTNCVVLQRHSSTEYSY